MPVKLKPKEKKKKPTEPEVPTFTGQRGETTGFTSPGGETFLGRVSKEEEEGIKKRFEPELTKMIERETAIKEEVAQEERKREVLGLTRPVEEEPVQEERPGLGEQILGGLSGRTLREAAEARGGELKTGVLPIGIPGAAAAKVPSLISKAVNVGRGSKMILDNLGIIVKLGKKNGKIDN